MSCLVSAAKTGTRALFDSPLPRGSLGGPLPPPHTHSLEDPALLQAVFATIPHGCVVHSLNGPVNGLEDILLQAL